MSDWRPDLINQLLETFIPKNAHIVIVGQKLESQTKKKEKWYNTQYDSFKIDPSILEDWNTCGLQSNFCFPEPNIFIATDFDLVSIEKDAYIHKTPLIIHDTPMIRVWFKQDTDFMKPKTIMNFDFSNPIVYSDPLNCNLTHLFVQLFKDDLNEYLYAADLAELRLNVTNTTYGVSVRIKSYNRISRKK